MRDLGVRPTEIRAIGGGATSPLWLQLQADVYGAPIHRLAVEEGAAYGAALLGHVAAGTFADVDEATSVVRTLDEVDRARSDARRACTRSTYGVYRSLYGTLREDMHRLGGARRAGSLQLEDGGARWTSA